MARIVSQMSVFEYSGIEELGDLERLRLALSGMDDEELMERLENRRGRGRNEYPIRALWHSVIAMRPFGHNTIESLRRELMRNSQLRRILGFDDFSKKKHLVPPARVFSRFIRSLEVEINLVMKIFNDSVKQLTDLLPDFGVNMAGDGKYLDSYAKNAKKNPSKKSGRRGEHDATYSVKEYKYTGADGRTHTKKETHYGFRAHVICDIATELPISFNVTPANVSEKPEMSNLLRTLSDRTRERADTLALDRGYDSTAIIKEIKNSGITPIVDICNHWQDGEETHQYKNTNIVYNFKGDVFYCEYSGGKTENVKMKYEGYDKTKKCLRYSHNKKIYKIYISYDERVFLPVARDSIKFSRLYKGRTAVERLNGRIDRDFMYERTCVRGLAKMRLSITLTFLTMNCMAVAKVKAGLTKHLAATKTGLLARAS